MSRVFTILAIGTLLLAACASDDDSSTESSEEPTETVTEEPTVAATDEPTEVATEEPTATATTEPTTVATEAESPNEEPVAFCADFIEAGNQVALVETGAGDPDALVAAVDQALASAPDGLADDVAVMAEFARSGGTGDFAAFDASSVKVLAWVIDNCATTSVDVTAVDYAYENFPQTTAAGITAISLDNQGAEFHEAAVLRINDGVDATAEELLALPEEEVESMVTFQGAVFADPGASGADIFDLSEPGNYIVACFIPVGATPEAAAVAEGGGPEPDGPPHFTQGMLGEFTVE